MSEPNPNGPDLNHLMRSKGGAPEEDDLLGLLGQPTPKAPSPAPRPVEPPLPVGVPPAPAARKNEPPLPFGVPPAPSKPGLDDPLGILSGGTSSAPKPTLPPTSPKPADPLGILGGGGPVPAPRAPLPDLDSLRGFPQSSPTPMPPPVAVPPSAPAKPSLIPQAAKALKGQEVLRGVQAAAGKLKFPKKWLVPAAAVLVVLLAGVGWWAFQKPSYRLVDKLTPLHLVRIEVNQIIELDITAYLDIESKLQALGFSPLVKVTVPEIPSPNLIAVYAKPDGKTYAVILKLPGVISPQLSFVSCLSTGKWISTNGWASHNQELEKISSESYPKDGPENLWNRHKARVQQMVQAQIPFQPLSENRFMSALSDHLRWYMDFKGIQGYKAQFDDWF